MESLKFEDMKDGSFAILKNHNIICFKIPEGSEILEGSAEIFGSYPDPEPYTVMFAYKTKGR